MSQSEQTFMVRIPWRAGDKCHIVGEIGEADPNSEPPRAFWTNASVKALMGESPQPEYISRCKRVRGDWRSIEVAPRPFATNDLCRQCARTTA